MVCLPGCHNNTAAPSGNLSFKDEKSMRDALKGTWILEEYVDSIDAGLTPKLLEYMLEKMNQISYSPAPKNLVIKGVFHPLEMNSFWDLDRSVDSCMVIFEPHVNKLVFNIVEHYYASKHLIDTAEFIFNGPDTLLRVYQGAAVIDFIKYDASHCPGISEYDHLTNSKFIAGKYYLDSDTEKKHHILFTKCGGVEGAENISADLRGFNSYKTVLPFNLIGPDELNLYEGNKPSDNQNMSGEMCVAIFSWEVKTDSLILKPERMDKRIVLVKAR